jgi:hypothetical protein
MDNISDYINKLEQCLKGELESDQCQSLYVQVSMIGIAIVICLVNFYL